MDFSHLHTYAPPQYVPDNTGYTYSLSSSYSSAALDFETNYNLDPVFDSPKMSRRSLRISAAAYDSPEGGSFARKMPEPQLPRTTRQRKNVVQPSEPLRRSPRRSSASSSSVSSQSSFSGRTSDTSYLTVVLDKTSIQEQTAVKHLWGLDDDGDLKGGQTTVIRANGDAAAAQSQSALSNGYTGDDCGILSERKEVLTAFSAAHMPPTRIYSRDRSQKHKYGGLTFYTSKILEAAKSSVTSVPSLLVQLFHVVLLRLGYESKAYSDPYGSTDVQGTFKEDYQLGTNGGYFCDDCKGKKQLEVHTAANMRSSRSKGVARTIWHIFSYTGSFMLSALQSTGTAGWLASKKVLSLLWLAVVSPGKAISGIIWLLGTGWYQFVTVISLLNVFILTRCLPKLFKMLLYLIPVFLLIGLWFWGSEAFLSFLPALNLSTILNSYRWDSSVKFPEPIQNLPNAARLAQPPTVPFDSNRMADVEKRMALLTEKFQDLNGEHGRILLRLQNFQDQLNDKNELVTTLQNVVNELLQELVNPTPSVKPDFEGILEDHTGRILVMENALSRLSDEFASKSTVQMLLRSLELRIMRRVNSHITEMNTRPPPELVTVIMNEAGVTEEQAHTIVDNALKLHAEDRIGMADFALESAGGSILSTRCSETYNTQTAVISLFGFPLWYFSQSPRAVIQPEVYPGNCWAFQGSQGHLVIRLAMDVLPTVFTLEHIPKSLSPKGNIDSAPKEFAVYGLADEYDEEGVLLGKYMYDQDEEALQMFPVTEVVDKAFRIVELKVLSNWGNPEFTCLYRFRVHGRLPE
ncbi:SUN domain-containing protein 1 isoform X2 [Paroedura picta]|uniref:SUN domain-containing protein 1 isoform X2 n=1 Tax=Paroedura picta TaxID=143630 RepID=UPI004056CD47